MRIALLYWVVVWVIIVLSVSTGSAEVAKQAKQVDMQDKTCVDGSCHGDLQSQKVLHGPVAQGNCMSCHTQAEPKHHTFKLSHEPDKLCQACHVMQMRTVVHKPVREGKCSECHDPHQSNHRFLLRKDPARDLCLTCHSDEAFMKRKYLHGPVAAGACILCHESHSSWHAKLMVKKGRELCLFCHEDIDRRLAEERHVHQAVREECDTCHDPHGSEHPMQLREGGNKLCLGCHEDMAEMIEKSEHPHGAITAKDGCRNCHSAHATMLPRLLKKPLLEICLSCHDREIELPDGGGTLANMKALLKENPEHHDPVKRADCTACHNPHASPNFRLLSKKYPEFFYAPFDLANYDLCFQCHQRDIVLVKYGKGLTRFEDGDLNLHFVHVNKKVKGRTCRACHEVHASKNPAHIRDTVPFGDWKFELKFEKTDTGGKCAPACHEPAEYVRQQNALTTTAPAKDSKGTSIITFPPIKEAKKK